jgi:hypothetical protein
MIRGGKRRAWRRSSQGSQQHLAPAIALALSRTPTAKKISGSSSNRIFKPFDDIVDHCCYAWNTLSDQPWKIISIANRDRAAASQSIRGLVLVCPDRQICARERR